jgi:hypothetical protein
MLGLKRTHAALVIALVALTPLPSIHPINAAPAGQSDDDNIVVAFSSPRWRQAVRGIVTIAGHAVDLRATRGSGLNEDDIQVYLDDSTDPRNLLYYPLTERGMRSSEAAEYRPPGERMEFLFDWETCTFPSGPHTLIVWVSSLTVPGARRYATVDFTILPCPAAEVLEPDKFPSDTMTARVDPADRTEPHRDHLFHTAFPLANYVVGGDARCLRPGLDCRVGIVFRMQYGPETPQSARSAIDSGYLFYVDPIAGTFQLEYQPPGAGPERRIPLIGPTASAAIRRGTAFNRLAVIADGPQLRLFVNGEAVGGVTSDHARWGGLGYAYATRERDLPVDMEFGNFVIATVGPVEALGPVLYSSR